MIIYKYPLVIGSEQCLSLPSGAVILSLQVKDNTPYIWAMVDERFVHNETRQFVTIWTGHKFNHDPRNIFIGTYQIKDSWDEVFVGHVFERIV